MIESGEKLAINDRAIVAKDIIINIKDDMKLMAEKETDPVNRLSYYLIAQKACDLAIQINGFMMAVLQIEDHLKACLEKDKQKGE